MPSSPAQIASFLGMTSYYLRFLPQYSSTTAPLRLLPKKDMGMDPCLRKCGHAAEGPAHRTTSIRPLRSHPARRFSPVMPPTTQWGLCCLSFTTAQSGLLLLPPELLTQQRKYSVGEREALACVW